MMFVMLHSLASIIIQFLLMCNCGQAQSPELLYPFGTGAGDMFNPRIDDDGGSNVSLRFGRLPYFGSYYQDIYINNNGPLSFGQKFIDHTPESFPLSASMATLIAPFWDDIDNRGDNGGSISYRLTTDLDDIQRAREDVSRAKFAEVDDFIPTYLLIATWYQVPHYSQSLQQKNTFQVILATDKNLSFAIFLYQDIVFSSDAVAGFNAGDETRFYIISSPALDLDINSNVNKPGKWLFRIDSDSIALPANSSINCEFLPNLSNGNVTFTRRTPGSVANYSCDDGFVLMGPSSRICGINGSWSGEAPICEEIDCGPLLNPMNGTISSKRTNFGSVANYSCDSGFVLMGLSSRICEVNRSWSGDAPVCEEIDCGLLLNPVNGEVTSTKTTIGSVANYSCGAGFVLMGPSSRICGMDGSWSREIPVCKEIDCRHLSNPVNGKVTFTKTTVGSVANYSCDSGFDLTGLSSRMCEVNASWSGDAPVCELIKICEIQPCLNGSVCVPLESGYRCECPKRFEGITCKTEVNEMLTTPVIALPPSNSSIPIHTSVNLSCMATGVPPPQYTWFKDGVLIPGETKPFLYIPEVQPNDRGSYRCKAANPLGESTSEVAILMIPGILQYTTFIELSISSSVDFEVFVQNLSNLQITGTNTSILFVNITDSITVMNRTLKGTLLLTLLYHPQVNPTPSQLDFIRVALFAKIGGTASVTLNPVQRYDGCDAGEYLNYFWPETNLGVTALVSCPCQEYLGTFAGNVRRLCNGTFTEGAMWSPTIDDSACETKRSDISRQLCDLAEGLSNRTVENSRLIADVTSQTQNLTAPHVSIVSTVVEQLTSEASTNPEVRDNYLQTIDNIQQADEDAVFESQQKQNSSTRILRSLGSFLDNVNISTSNSTDNVTVFSYTAFSLQIQEIDVSTFGGQTFLVTLGSYEQARNHTQQISRNNLVTFNTVLNSTDANQLNFSEDSTASIQIPSSLSEQLITCSNLTLNQFQRLSYSVFLSDSLFQPKNRSQFRVASIILAPRFHCTLDNISEPIQTTFQTLPEEKRPSHCAAYDSEGFGGWDSSGCKEVRQENGEVTCECAQLGHFGLLLDLNPRPPPLVAAIFLSVITYIGLALSLICLFIFIITYLISKILRSTVHGQILVNMSVSLMALYITFLIGGFVTKVPALCGLVSALLQYFFLVFFAWTAVESVWLYLKLVAVLGTDTFSSRYMLKAGLPAWLVPVLIVVISVAPGYQYYISNYYCRATEWPFWFGHIVPFLLVYIFNWVMFSIIMVSICKHTRNMNSVMKEKTTAERAKEMKKNFIIAMSLSVVLGLGWGLGLAATSSSVVGLTVTFQVIFSIFVGMQGVLIFVLHGVRNKDARELWTRTLVTRSKHLVSSLKGSSVEYSHRGYGTDSDAFSTLPHSPLSKNVNLYVAYEKGTSEETKVDLPEVNIVPEQGRSSVEKEDLSEVKIMPEQESKSPDE